LYLWLLPLIFYPFPLFLFFLLFLSFAGKIIVFNQYCDWEDNPVDCYGTSVVYRAQGATAAAQVGAVAALIRTVAPFSINSPHTGVQE
jgi:carboxypeptidase Q